MLRAFAVVLFAGCISGPDLPGEVLVYDVHPTQFSTDGRNLYWLDTLPDGRQVTFGSALEGAPVSRLDLEPLGPGGYLLTMDAANLYVGDEQGVFQLPRVGGAPFDIAVNPPRDIELEGDTIFWCNEGPGDVLHWRARAGGAVTNVSILESVRQIVVDANTIYVEASRGVYTVSRSSGEVQKIANAADYDRLYPAEPAPMISTGLTKSGDHLDWMIHQNGYYTDLDRGALIEIPLPSGEAKVIAKDLYAPAMLVTDGAGTRYWFESEVNHASDRIGIRRLGPGETMPVDVLMGLYPSDLSIVGGQLYWSSAGGEYDSGYIRRMDVP